MAKYLNHYRCEGDARGRTAHGPFEWTDEWSCTCNDKCPRCGAEIEPYQSDDVDPEPLDLKETLELAESFISGFDEDELQEDIPLMLKSLRHHIAQLPAVPAVY